MAEPFDCGEATNFCGCFRATSAYTALRDALRIHKSPASMDADWKPYFQAKRDYEEQSPAHVLVIYLLDAQGYTEHGSSISGAWLTEKGEKVLAHLETYGCDPDKWPDSDFFERGMDEDD